MKVRRQDGKSLHLYIHVEIQGQYERGFARRMFSYHYRLFDKYGQRVVSLAVLGDERPKWRPGKYCYEIAGCSVDFRFPVVKLADWRDKWETLEQARNPFGIVVRIHLKAQETRGLPEQRLEWKFRLFKAFYEAKYSREDILRLFHFLDWVMYLPDDVEQTFDEWVLEYEEEKKMPYVTSIERFGIQKGLEQGLEQGVRQGLLQKSHEDILMVLSTRFKRLSKNLRDSVEAIEDPALLSELLKQAVTAESLKAFEKIVRDRKKTH